MGLFKSLFTNRSKEVVTSNINWLVLNDLNQLQEIQQASLKEPIFIFKHSTRCGISRMVMKQFEKMFDDSMSKVKVYYLDLLNYRAISNEIGYTFQVQHQSPQLLVIKDKVAIATASHYDITTVDLKNIII
ncbi:MAG: bacillithiol system redox-active protein YtxJ [Flavobacteriaceae bacterium]